MGGTARDIDLIWGINEAENFCEQDWTDKISLIFLKKFRFPRNCVCRGG
jgi:hypothetical protein